MKHTNKQVYKIPFKSALGQYDMENNEDLSKV